MLDFMFGARSKLYRAITVVIAVHRKTANALAIISTVVVMPLYQTPVLMRKLRIRYLDDLTLIHNLPKASSPEFPPELAMATVLSLIASFINLHTDARLIECRLATAVNDIPERRSETTCSRLMSSRARPICLPSNFALLMPDLTRSTINDRSSSLIAPTMTIMARPNGPPVSMFSLKLIKATFR
jgi:hypothetical protein